MYRRRWLIALAAAIPGLAGCGTFVSPAGSGPQPASAAPYLPNRVVAPAGFRPGNPVSTWLTAKIGWRLIPMGAAAGSEGAELARTTDGGAVWAPVASTNPTGSEGQLPTPGYKTGVSFVSAAKGWLAGSLPETSQAPVPEFYRTTDGGRHWSPVGLPGVPRRRGQRLVLNPPGFVNPADGLLIGYFGRIGEPGPVAALWVTTNGGASWHREPATGSGSLSGFSWAVLAATAVTVGLHGRQWTTVNDGLTWARIHHL